MSTIILNRMYAGGYLDENIGHEVINLFKDDNGSNYIYINHDGRINKESNDTVQAVLLVKHAEKGVLEVVAKAEKLQQIFYREKDSGKEIEYQNEYVKDHNITYGNVLLSDIYKKGNDEILITFKTDKLRTVKKPLFIIEDESKRNKYENSYFLPEKHFASTSLKMYYTEKDFPQDYDVFKKLLNDSTIWNEENTTKKVDLDEIYRYDTHESFLSVIKKENNELIISNLFAYIFDEKKDVFKGFVKEILGIDDFKIGYKIYREVSTSKNNSNKEGRIDLLIENEDSVIIIENKVGSDINGDQLDKYVKYVYEKYADKKLYFYVFAPNYNTINLDHYESGDKYKMIKYNQIYDFYFKNAGKMLNINYFKDFLNGIYIHTMTTDNTNFEEMKKQFIKNIKLKKED